MVLTERDERDTEPGVTWGSSSTLLEERPCHGLPGTNSGIMSLMLRPCGTEATLLGRLVLELELPVGDSLEVLISAVLG